MGNPGNENLNAMTSEEKADAKKLAHAAPPPVYVAPYKRDFRLGSPANHDLNAMTPEEKAEAKKVTHAPLVNLEPDQAKPRALRLGNPDIDDLHPMTSGEDEHVHNLFHMPPTPPARV